MKSSAGVICCASRNFRLILEGDIIEKAYRMFSLTDVTACLAKLPLVVEYNKMDNKQSAILMKVKAKR